MLKIKISRKNVILLFLALYLFVCIMFPLDKYSLKIIFFLIICILSIPEFVFAVTSRQINDVFIMGTVFPLLMVTLSFINNNNIYAAVSGSYVCCLILLVIPIYFLGIGKEFKSILMTILWIETLAILIIFLADFLGLFNVNADTPLRTFVYDMGSGYIGKSNAYSSYYRIYFKTSPLILFLLDDSWERKKWGRVFLSAFALYLSGTRANFLAGVIYITWRLLFKTFKNRKVQFAFATLIILLLIFGANHVISIWHGMMTSEGSVGSDNVRIGQLHGLLIALSNPFTLMFGEGLGTTFYDYGRSALETGVELAYFDLVRQIGLTLFLPFFLFVLKPISKNGVDSGIKVAFLCYMAIAFTNPLLFSSTAFVAYTLMYEEVYSL